MSVRQVWQDQFDSEYPIGLIMRWLHDQDTEPHYLIPRVEVIGTEDGFDPVVRLDVYGPDKSFVFTLVDYVVFAREPTEAVATGRGMHDQMLWTGDVPNDTGEQMLTWYLDNND